MATTKKTEEKQEVKTFKVGGVEKVVPAPNLAHVVKLKKG